MRRYLVVAHQTLDSPELLDVLRERLAEGPCTFHLVVPEYHGGLATWSDGGAKAEAGGRLEAARTGFLAEGLAVTGEVGDANPTDAVGDVLRRDGDQAYDAIIVSTLPHAVSRWLKIDAPGRIRRTTGMPVHHVVGHPVPA